jgi:hypothetical protein
VFVIEHQMNQKEKITIFENTLRLHNEQFVLPIMQINKTMTGGMVIVSYTSSSATAGSILMIQGINQSMTMTWFDQRITCWQTTKKAKHGERP